MICIIAENWENCVKIHVKNYKTGNTKWTISVRDRTPSANINSAIRLCEIVKSKVSLAWVLISIEFSHFPMKIRKNLHDKTAMARHSASRDPNSQIQLIKCRSKSEGIRLRLNKRLNDRFSNKKKFNPSIASRRWWPFHGDTNRLIDYDESSARCEPKVELGAREICQHEIIIAFVAPDATCSPIFPIHCESLNDVRKLWALTRRLFSLTISEWVREKIE